MKKLLVILFQFMPLVSMAQNFSEDGSKYEVYCDVKDFTNAYGGESFTITINESKYVIIDNQGKEVKTKEVTQILNLLAKRGWKLVSSFGMNGTNGVLPTEKHYTMVKEVTNDKEIETGLLIKK